MNNAQSIDAMRKLPVRLVQFWACMATELEKNQHKGGWKDDTLDALFNRLVEESVELKKELMYRTKNFNAIIKEACDVANFAFFIADNAAMYKQAQEDGQ